MGDDHKKEDGADELYRVQTVPPPAGETDAYSAPTKVGPMASAVIGEIIEHAKRTGGVVEVLGDIREPASEPKEIRKPPPKEKPKAKDPVAEDDIPESQPIQPMAVINVASEPPPSFPPPPKVEEIKTPPIAVADVEKQFAAALDPEVLAAQANTPMPMPVALSAPPPVSAPAPSSSPQPEQPMAAVAPAAAPPSRVRLIVLLVILVALVVATTMLFIRK